MNFERIVTATAGVGLLLAVLDHLLDIAPLGGNDVVQTSMLLMVGVGLASVLPLFNRDERDTSRHQRVAEVNIPGVYVGPERRTHMEDRRSTRAGGRRIADR